MASVTADSNCSAIVRLEGGASFDADGDALTFTWSGPFGTVSGASAAVSLAAGTHVVTLTCGMAGAAHPPTRSS
jgi:hypothetical protein